MTTPIEEARERATALWADELRTAPAGEYAARSMLASPSPHDKRVIAAISKALLSTPSPVTVEVGEVTQADREAAANMIRSYWQPWHDGDWHKLASSIEAGSCDHSPFVQVLFRHRLAALSTNPKPAKVADREEIADIISAMVSGPPLAKQQHDLKEAHRRDLLACADALLALPLPALVGWKHIETAPKDGTRIWLYYPDRSEDDRQVVGWWREGIEPRWMDHADACDWDEPSHWRERPASPSPAASEGK